MVEINKERLKVLSLGAGVQSSTMFLLSCLGEIPKADVAIFADTQAEPGAVYRYLHWLMMIGHDNGIPVETVTAGDLAEAVKDTNGFAPIPFFSVRNGLHTVGQARRQCTYQYKLRPIRKRVRELLKERKCRTAEMMIGISLDEVHRMKPSNVKYIENTYPLIDIKKWTRGDCLAWVRAHKFLTPPRSACSFCPYRSNREWEEIKLNDHDAWMEALAVDRALRKRPAMSGYLHREARPLELIDFRDAPGQMELDLFANECEGMCGV